MLSKETYERIRSTILQKLGIDLSKDLFYHSVQHTIDVEEQAERIALSEHISNEQDLLLLKIACLYHDSGFLFTYNDHEDAGCKLVRQELPAFGLTEKEIRMVCDLIEVTKIPQTPVSKMEEIICDADLDYLGRDDFFSISNHLYLELKARNIISSEDAWNHIQIKFFKQHHYFTDTSKRLRETKKQYHLKMIEARLYKNTR